MAKDKSKDKWMQDAVKNPGSFRKLAAKEKAIDKAGKIKPSFIEKETKSSNPTTKKRAVLAKTFSKFRKK